VVTESSQVRMSFWTHWQAALQTRRKDAAGSGAEQRRVVLQCDGVGHLGDACSGAANNRFHCPDSSAGAVAESCVMQAADCMPSR